MLQSKIKQYPQIAASKFRNPNFLIQKVIANHLTLSVHEENETYLYKLDRLRVDSFDKFDDDQAGGNSKVDRLSNIHTPEFLNSINCSGIPNHELKLKVGVPVMLLRNIDFMSGLCNGTRLLITRLEKHVLEVDVINGSHIGDKVYIPRISFSPSGRNMSISFEMRH